MRKKTITSRDFHSIGNLQPRHVLKVVVAMAQAISPSIMTVGVAKALTIFVHITNRIKSIPEEARKSK